MKRVTEEQIKPGGNLKHVDLSGLDLQCEDLTRANLRGANLSQVNLSGANLTGANLTRAILRGADLSGANLRGAVLIRADLTMAKLELTDLTGADLWSANLDDVDGLETVIGGGNVKGQDLPHEFRRCRECQKVKPFSGRYRVRWAGNDGKLCSNCWTELQRVEEEERQRLFEQWRKEAEEQRMQKAREDEETRQIRAAEAVARHNELAVDRDYMYPGKNGLFHRKK